MSLRNKQRNNQTLLHVVHIEFLLLVDVFILQLSLQFVKLIALNLHSFHALMYDCKDNRHFLLQKRLRCRRLSALHCVLFASALAT